MSRYNINYIIAFKDSRIDLAKHLHHHHHQHPISRSHKSRDTSICINSYFSRLARLLAIQLSFPLRMSKPQPCLPRAALVAMYRQVKEQARPEGADPRKDINADRKTEADGAKLPPQPMPQNTKETKQARRKEEEEGTQALRKKGGQTVEDWGGKQVKGLPEGPERSEKDCRANEERGRAKESRKTENMVRGSDKESKRTDKGGDRKAKTTDKQHAKMMKIIDDELAESMRKIEMEYKKSMKQLERLPGRVLRKEGHQV